MGWRGELIAGPALALGVDVVSPLEVASAYAPFANGGFQVAPHIVTRIETSDGDLIYQRTQSLQETNISRSAIEGVNEMLESVVAWGTGRAAAVPGYRTAGKTGTTQGSRDAWFAGHAGGLVAAVWVGRDDNQPMHGVTGGRAPTIIWREIMVRALPPRYAEPITIAPLSAAPQDDPIAEMLSDRDG